MARVVIVLEDVPSGVPGHNAIRIELQKSPESTAETSQALRIARALYDRVLNSARNNGGAVFTEKELKEEGS